MDEKITLLNPRRTPERDEAEAIMRGARRRGLGARPLLRRAAAVLWSAFLGAVVGVGALALAPEDAQPPTLDEQGWALTFGLVWLLCLIPALSASVLASPPGRPSDDER